jgi:hypothetical protein
MFQESERMQSTGGGWAHLPAENSHRYDVIVLDAYYADAIPFI